MNSTIQMDQAGRVVLPKQVRERFRLRGGDTLALEIDGEGIHLRPSKATNRLERINGVLVLTTGAPLPEQGDLVEQAREDRLDEITRSMA